MKTNIYELDLSVRALGCLNQTGFFNIADIANECLVQGSIENFLLFINKDRRFSVATINEIQATLSLHFDHK